jgi:hypothetical protein
MYMHVFGRLRPWVSLTPYVRHYMHLHALSSTFHCPFREADFPLYTDQDRPLPLGFRDALWAEPGTLLLEDCTATCSPDFCLQATLHNVRFCFGFTVRRGDFVTATQLAE